MLEQRVKYEDTIRKVDMEQRVECPTTTRQNRNNAS